MLWERERRSQPGGPEAVSLSRGDQSKGILADGTANINLTRQVREDRLWKPGLASRSQILGAHQYGAVRLAPPAIIFVRRGGLNPQAMLRERADRILRHATFQATVIGERFVGHPALNVNRAVAGGEANNHAAFVDLERAIREGQRHVE